jgi:hypothetical protein
MEASIGTTTADVLGGVRALSVAVDTLARIAELGGVQGDWAKDALGEVNALVMGERPALRAVEGGVR